MTEEQVNFIIESIVENNEHIEAAIKAIDNSVPQKSEAIAKVVEARELTNRMLLKVCYECYVYEKPITCELTSGPRYDSTQDDTF